MRDLGRSFAFSRLLIVPMYLPGNRYRTNVRYDIYERLSA